MLSNETPLLVVSANKKFSQVMPVIFFMMYDKPPHGSHCLDEEFSSTREMQYRYSVPHVGIVIRV